MKQKLQTIATSARNHVTKHRAKYAAAATLAGCIVVNQIRVNQVNDFLAENGLLDKFYDMNEDLSIES